MARVFVTRVLPGPALGRLHEAGHEVTVHPGELPPTRAELEAGVRDAEALLCLLTDPVDAALLAGAPRLRAIANYAVGSDNIDLAACKARGIPVGVTPDALTDATADLTMALLLAAARRLPEAERTVREGRWTTWTRRACSGSSCAARAWRSSARGGSAARWPSAPARSAWRSNPFGAATTCTPRWRARTRSRCTSR